MTKAVRSRILKDANGQISDHLRNHIHLTNCIHLKNHMHKQSPMLTDRSLMRDLIVLQRSRSLRDPSASPPSWHSPSVADLLPKKGDKDSVVAVEGRRSIGVDRQKESRRLSGGSSPFSLQPPRVVPGEIASDHSSKSGGRGSRGNRREESSLMSNGEGRLGDEDVGSRNSGSKSRKSKQKGKKSEDFNVKTISEQLNEVGLDSDVASSNVRGYSGPKGGKRRKFRGARRTRATPSRDVGGVNEMSVASNSLAQGSTRPRSRYQIEEEPEGEEIGDHNVTRIPKNGCGIPFNWSRIHHRSKTFLDKAGRSLSCGLSDTKLRRGGIEREESDYSGSYTKTDAEALPLLVDASGSLESTDNANWVHDYSGELGLYADHLLKNNLDSDLASDAWSGGQQKHKNGSHQSLTQKYTPKTFRDLVGQNLVAQALSNAVMRRKIGSLYVFYGPHGTGKTSSARIFARALNCQSMDHPKPCGYCKSCVAYDMGKSRNVREIGPVSNFDFEGIMDLLDNMIISHLPSQYRVFIFDDCDTLSPDCWSAITKVIDRAPRRVVFVLVSTSLDALPHIIISRCQKFFFPKLKDADIIYTLQWIASREYIDIDKDALKLIASRSDGSLRDAEMTLEQLSLLGQRISVPLVQELVGLISDEKLVDLLDLALSADTVNTVKNLRVIMETCVEPLALMSQLATVITDILAGTYDFTKDRNRRKFFKRHPLSKEHMEKLRQALKTLSEAEKQLRVSNDKLTWLTAALLQLAPDQQYVLPSSSAETSLNHSPLPLNNPNGRNVSRTGASEMASKDRGLQIGGKTPKGCEEIWLEVLRKIRFNSVKEFLYREGKLVSVSFGPAPTVQLLFSSHFTKSKAENFMAHILQAFESVIGSPVTIEIRCESSTSGGFQQPIVLPASKNIVGSEIVEIPASPREIKRNEDKNSESSKRGENLGESAAKSGRGALSERTKVGQLSQSKSIVRSKVSLAHVIQQAEGGAWSKRKAVSIAERLEQENLRLEPRSRSLICWKASRVTRRKLSRLKIRSKRPRSLLKLVSCGKCLSARSPRP